MSISRRWSIYEHKHQAFCDGLQCVLKHVQTAVDQTHVLVDKGLGLVLQWRFGMGSKRGIKHLGKAQILETVTINYNMNL